MKSKRIYSCVYGVIFLMLFSASLRAQDKKIFRILNKVAYPSDSLTDKVKSFVNMWDFINPAEIEQLNKWDKEVPLLPNFYNAECAGCSTDWATFRPVYKITEGNRTHFGIKRGLGIRNYVFTRRRKLLTSFYTFQGQSAAELDRMGKRRKKEGKNKGHESIISVLSSKLSDRKMYSKHYAYAEHTRNKDWYNTMSALSIDYYVDCKEKEPQLHFIFKSGLHTDQWRDTKGKWHIINFYEPDLVAHAQPNERNNLWGTFAYGYYAEATFYLLNVKEKVNLSIDIKSKRRDRDFRFSVLKNTSYRTMSQHIEEGAVTHSHFRGVVEKGQYLIRVLNDGPNDRFEPCYEIDVEAFAL